MIDDNIYCPQCCKLKFHAGPCDPEPIAPLPQQEEPATAGLSLDFALGLIEQWATPENADRKSDLDQAIKIICNIIRQRKSEPAQAIQRYRADYDGDDGLNPHTNGDYVKFEDYSRLIAEKLQEALMRAYEAEESKKRQ